MLRYARNIISIDALLRSKRGLLARRGSRVACASGKKIEVIIVFLCRRIPSFRGREGEIVQKGVAGDFTVTAGAVKFRSWVRGGANPI